MRNERAIDAYFVTQFRDGTFLPERESIQVSVACFLYFIQFLMHLESKQA